MTSEALALDHWRNRAAEIELRAGELFRVEYPEFYERRDAFDEQIGLYKCALCGESGTFIGHSTHFRSDAPSSRAQTIWRDSDNDQVFWCAGRPDLRPR